MKVKYIGEIFHTLSISIAELSDIVRNCSHQALICEVRSSTYTFQWQIMKWKKEKHKAVIYKCHQQEVWRTIHTSACTLYSSLPTQLHNFSDRKMYTSNAHQTCKYNWKAIKFTLIVFFTHILELQSFYFTSLHIKWRFFIIYYIYNK